MSADKPILDYDRPSRVLTPTDLEQAMSTPTGRRTMSFWWLLLLIALVDVAIFVWVLAGVVF
jgi:hypothetical protein